MCDKYMYLYNTMSIQCSNCTMCVYMYMYETYGHRHSSKCDAYCKGSVNGNILCLRHTLYALVV